MGETKALVQGRTACALLVPGPGTEAPHPAVSIHALVLVEPPRAQRSLEGQRVGQGQVTSPADINLMSTYLPTKGAAGRPEPIRGR